MEINRLKKCMKKLWKDTFHDSDVYISLVFDNYFNLDNIEYYEEDGALISALLGVPYSFGYGNLTIRGLYLCGLATVESYRNRGIMKNLITKINKRALANGYAFTFLIPSSDALRLYYSKSGYLNAIYRVEDRYTDIHNFKNEYMSILANDDERIRLLKARNYDSLTVIKLDINNQEEIKKTIRYISSIENEISTYLGLHHSQKDILAILEENSISNGDIYICKTPNGEISGVAFMNASIHKRINIPKIYHKDGSSYYKLLDRIKEGNRDQSISVFYYPEESNRQILWQQIYRAANQDGEMLGGAYRIADRTYDAGRHAKSYGMVKLLDFREILKFLAKYRSDCKFSILIKDYEIEDYALKCDIEGGMCNFNTVSNDLADIFKKKDPDLTILSKQNLAEILLRRKDNSNLIMEALGIPRLAMNMSLLLD